jgi:hypothetical protein
MSELYTASRQLSLKMVTFFVMGTIKEIVMFFEEMRFYLKN